MKLEKFAEKEKLKDFLLSIVKHDKTIDELIVEPASNVVENILNTYIEIGEEGGAVQASEYLFTVMSNYVMLSMQLIDMNKHLMEKLREEDKYL